MKQPPRAQNAQPPKPDVPELPKEVDLSTNRGKADLQKDLQAMGITPGDGVNPLLQTPSPTTPAPAPAPAPTDPVPQEQEMAPATPLPEEKYPKWLLELIPFLPEGCTPDMVLEFKNRYNAVYFVELPSGNYLYRPIMRPEHRNIVGADGITRELIEERIVCLCTLYPVLTPLDLRDGAKGTRAGTGSTLCNTILESSDFGTVNVQPVKL